MAKAKAKDTTGGGSESATGLKPVQEVTGPKGGAPTSETRILACQCGSTGFDVKKRTKTAISLVCAKCGLRASVKGNVATVRVRQQEIMYALAHTIVTPDDTPDDDDGGTDPGDAVGDGSGPTGPEYITLRFRIMKGDQKDGIDRVMEKIRIMNCADDKFRDQTWQGHALEYMAADCESGMPDWVHQTYDAMEAAEADAYRIAEQDGKAEPNARKIRDLRAKVRDKLAYEMGVLPPEMMGEDARQLDLPESKNDGETADQGGETEDPGEEEEPDDDSDAEEPDNEPDDEPDDDSDAEEPEPVPDEGRLLKAVQTTLETYYQDAKDAGAQGDELPEFVVRDGAMPPDDMIQKWSKEGGYLIRILGDKRTVNGDGSRASVVAWVATEPADLALDFSLEYDDATDDLLGDGAVEVVELLPPDYSEIDQWPQPHFADRREVMR